MGPDVSRGRSVFAPFFTFVIMMPIALCLLAPIGNYIGNGIAVFFEWLASTPFGVLAVVLIAATWPLLVLTGMHVGLAASALAQYAQVGSDSAVLMAAITAAFTASGGAAAGLYGGLTGVKFYANASGLFSFAAFTGGEPANLINGCIGIAIGFVVAFIVTWLFGFTDAQLDGKE